MIDTGNRQDGASLAERSDRARDGQPAFRKDDHGPVALQQPFQVLEVRPGSATAGNRKRIDGNLRQPRFPLAFEDRVRGGDDHRAVAVAGRQGLGHHDRIEGADMVGDENRRAAELAQLLTIANRQPAEARQGREQEA